MADDTNRGRTRGDERAIDDDRDLSGGDRHDAGGPFLDEGGYDEGHDREDPGDTDWGGRLAAVLVVGGIALLLIPEPATSGAGSLMLIVGAFLWLIDAIG